jgi:hypothetical protein
MFASQAHHRLWPSSESHLRPSRTPSTPHPPPSIEIPIDPQLELNSRAPQQILSAESRDRERRVASPSPTRSRDDNRCTETGGPDRTSGQHFDPPLDRDNSLGPQGSNNTELPGPAHLLNNTPMHHRAEPFAMSSSHARDYNSRYAYSHNVPSPPPITTLSHSPSLSVSSLDHSSTSSPHPPRRPLARSPLESYSDSYHSQETSSHRHSSGAQLHPSPRSTHAHPYHRPTYEQRYNSNDANSPYQMPSSFQSHTAVPSMGAAGGPSMRENHMYTMPGQTHISIVHTDDATTKLSDRVRRRCFNCCTTDTSTWRRSNLSPGKVLCNKCGLFERTHSRPRPDQFSHRRGSMPTSSDPIQSRTPPGSLPPITNQAHSLPPHHYEHPSIPPLVNIPDARRTRNPTTLPEIQSWVNSPQISSTQSSSSRYQEQTPYRSQPSPPIIRLQHGSEDSHNAPSSHA